MDSVHSASRPPRRGLRRRIVVAFVMTATALTGIVLVFAQPVQGATPHRAAVVVEVDGVIHTAKITFTADSISGLDALRSAGFDPTVRVFGGNGGAVCALDVGGTTIGCPADNSCLKCATDSSYWSYWRALAGETKYTWSSVGASSTAVRDGGVEAWNWSTGAAPSPFVSFASVWGSDPPPTTRPPATHAPTTRPSASTVTGVDTLGTAAPVTTAPASTGSPTSTSGPAGATRTTARHATTTAPVTTGTRTADSQGDARRLATAPVVSKHRGGSSWGLAGFALILALLVGAIVLARRQRRRGAPASP